MDVSYVTFVIIKEERKSSGTRDVTLNGASWEAFGADTNRLYCAGQRNANSSKYCGFEFRSRFPQ